MLPERLLHALKTVLPPGQVFTDKATLIAYQADAGLDKGLPEGVVFPRTTDEVIRVVRWATEHQVPLIARGAGTGLSGGAVADRGGIIVEFVHMNRILDIDSHGRCAVVEPAVINLHLDERARAEGLYFPPDPSSQRASTMGGNVAENSGGPHCFKYGVMTNYVAGMQLVLTDGSCIRIGGQALDYPEYDLCGLVTGSEGMLALITSITVRLRRNPPGVKTLLAVFDSVEQAGDAVSAVIAEGLVPATMEMMDQQIVRIIEPFAHANLPLDAGAVLIIEVDGYPESLDAQMSKIIAILQRHNGHAMRVARDEEERYKIWLARKSAAGAMAREAPAFYIVDITVPRSSLSIMLAEVNRICERHNIRAGHVFHAGDGNLHPNLIIPEPDDPELLARVHSAGKEMVKYCVELGGSLTGEHGVGIEKRQFMSLMHTPDELLAMWEVKQAFDPTCLLNPGKIFPTPAQDSDELHTNQVPHQPASTPLPPTESVWQPATAQEAARGLAELARAGRRVIITGEREPQEQTEAYQYLSTAALSGIKAYAPDDLSITVGAGSPLATIQTFLARENKQLALASPWPTATIGGLVAANSNAPLRMRYGALRDLVLCATVALPDGRVIRTGRPIVKNVAGFDLTKPFVGSYGTLGLLVDISLKIMAQPHTRRTLLIPIANLDASLPWIMQLVRLALNASAIVLCKDYHAAEMPQSAYLLAYTAEGVLEDVQAELVQVRQALQRAGVPDAHEVEQSSGTDIWTSQLEQAQTTAFLVRIGVSVSDLPTYLYKQAALLDTGSYIADVANGFVYAWRQCATGAEARVWLDALRAPAIASAGYAVVMGMPAAWRDQLDPWGYRPQGLSVMHRLKARWDPHGIINPGVFIVDVS